MAEGMRAPADIPNPEDSDDSDGYCFSDSDAPVPSAATVAAAPGGGANGRAGGAGAMAVATAPVPEWSELETAVQALMGMEGGGVRVGAEECEDGWDATESAR